MSISGAFLSAKIGSTAIEGVMEWTVEEEAEELDRTSGATGGFGDRDGGVLDATITMRLFQDTTTGEYAIVSARTVISALNLFRNGGDPLPGFAFPSVVVLRSGNPVKVRGGCYVDVTAKNKGAYTRNEPGASA